MPWRRTRRSDEASRASQGGFLNSLAGALTNVQQTTPTIQETAVQNQTNLQAAAVASQQRQQAQEQTRLPAQQRAQSEQATTPSASSYPSNGYAIVSPTTAASAATINPSTQSCSDMTNYVQGSAIVGSDGWLSGWLVNNSDQAVHVFYTFEKSGQPSNDMDSAGATNLWPSERVGGEGQGLYSTSADKNPGRIHWYAVLRSDYDLRKSCATVHRW